MTEGNTTPAFLIIAQYRLDPADMEAFKEITRRMAEGARQKPGNLFLNAAQNVADANLFHLTEGWVDQASFDEHLHSQEFQSVLKEALALRIVERSGSIYFVAGAQVLDMPT